MVPTETGNRFPDVCISRETWTLVTSFVEILHGVSCNYGILIRPNVVSLCRVSNFLSGIER